METHLKATALTLGMDADELVRMMAPADRIAIPMISEDMNPRAKNFEDQAMVGPVGLSRGPMSLLGGLTRDLHYMDLEPTKWGKMTALGKALLPDGSPINEVLEMLTGDKRRGFYNPADVWGDVNNGLEFIGAGLTELQRAAGPALVGNLLRIASAEKLIDVRGFESMQLPAWSSASGWAAGVVSPIQEKLRADKSIKGFMSYHKALVERTMKKIHRNEVYGEELPEREEIMRAINLYDNIVKPWYEGSDGHPPLKDQLKKHSDNYIDYFMEWYLPALLALAEEGRGDTEWFNDELESMGTGPAMDHVKANIESRMKSIDIEDILKQ